MSSLGEVVVKVTANINEFKANLQEAQTKLDGFGTKIKTTSENFATVGKVAGIAGAAVAAGLGFAVKTTADFDSQMSKVKALSGATEEQFKSLRDTAIDLGAKSVYSASEAAEGMSILAAAGLNSEQVIAAMPGLLDAAAASGEDFANVSDIMVSAMSGFGMEAKDMGHIADVLASAANASSISISDIGYSLKYVAPVAKTAGLSIEEVSSALAILGNAGIKAETAGTSLRMSLTQLAAPPKEAAEMIEKLGIKVTDTEGKLLPLKDLIGQLNEKFGGLTQAQKMEAASTIFGTNAMSAMLTLIDAGPDKLDELTQSFKNADGAANQMAETMTDNLSGSIEQLKGAAESALISIGSTLSPAIRKVAEGIQAMVNSFNSLPDPVKNSIVTIVAVAAGITLLAAGIGLIIGFYTNPCRRVLRSRWSGFCSGWGFCFYFKSCRSVYRCYRCRYRHRSAFI
ncbi:MAG: phage tail tape measure protein [Desulfotomaculaceae bacterium]